MTNPFTLHPKSINESYLQHLCHAGKFSLMMLAAGTTCLIHAIFPFIFEKTASNLLFKMTERMVSRMPCTEDRVVRLSNCIAKKAQ